MTKNSLKQVIRSSRLLSIVLFLPLLFRRFVITKRWSRKQILLRQLSKHLAEDPIIKVTEFDGIFAVDKRSDLFSRIIIEDSYEPKLVNLCLRFLDLNKDVIDIGANIGFFTVFFAKRIRKTKVLAVEPTKNALIRLKRNVELNNVQDIVTIYEGIASDKSGTAKIKIIEGKEEFSTTGEMLHPSIKNETWTTADIDSNTIDQLVIEHSLHPGLIKIDVEGAELAVINGALDVLEQHRPIIISELSDFLLRSNGTSSAEVIALIQSKDYDIFNPFYPDEKPGIDQFGDIICFPKEMKMSSVLLS